MPSESPWIATYVSWQRKGRCTEETGFNFTPDIESSPGLEKARGWCNFCPVRTECLRYALLNGEEGYWGGTDTAQRRKLRAKKDRAKCPVCTSVNLVRLKGHELCLACGLSWAKAAPPKPKPVNTGDGEDVIVAERYL